MDNLAQKKKELLLKKLKAKKKQHALLENSNSDEKNGETNQTQILKKPISKLRIPSKPISTPPNLSVNKFSKLLYPQISFNSSAQSLNLFTWMIHPTTPKAFFEKYFEKKPYIIKRNDPTYYANIWDREILDQAIRANNLTYGIDIDLVNYNKNDDLRKDFR